MELELILSFLAASILLTLMPGPDNLFVLVESVTKGHKQGITISLGLVTGVLVHTLAAATGLSIIIQKSAIAFSVLKYLGAAYLIYLAVVAAKEKPGTINISTIEKKDPERFFPLVRKGFLMNVLNPKVSLFFIAFLPQFISQTGIHITLQMIVLGLIFMVQAFIIFSLVSILSGKLRSQVNNRGFWKVTKWIKVSVLSILGIALALSRK